jgi:hypothetical protein
MLRGAEICYILCVFRVSYIKITLTAARSPANMYLYGRIMYFPLGLNRADFELLN